jgi:mevalonate kinase
MSSECFDIPGKVFVLGEYAVFGGLPAVVASVAPRFSGSLRVETNKEGDYHPESPVGRFLRWVLEHRQLKCSFHFKDPYQSGGFGASTAQFAIAYAAGAQRLELEYDWRSIWRFYRDLMVDEGNAPSGADLVAQLLGGVNLFDPATMICNDLWTKFDWSRLLIFAPEVQPDRKIATHVHLKWFFSESQKAINKPRLFSRLATPLKKGLAAIEHNRVDGLGAAMNWYADVLAEYDLEARATFEDRQVLRAAPGVCGVKGSGALQADIVLALITPCADAEPVVRSARTRGLKLVCRGLTWQSGIQRSGKGV